MTESTVRASGYRFVVLAAFMLAVAANQLLWISFAPITRVAASFYGVSDLAIGLLSLVFMLVFMFPWGGSFNLLEGFDEFDDFHIGQVFLQIPADTELEVN